ncbi:hypothetical protein AMTRI_Chr11g95580 [Amborella trichopoda]
MTTKGYIGTVGARIQTVEVQFLVCQSVVRQTKHCWSSHYDCRSMHSDCRNAVLQCRSVVAPEDSLPGRTSGACSCIVGTSY